MAVDFTVGRGSRTAWQSSQAIWEETPNVRLGGSRGNPWSARGSRRQRASRFDRCFAANVVRGSDIQSDAALYSHSHEGTRNDRLRVHARRVCQMSALALDPPPASSRRTVKLVGDRSVRRLSVSIVLLLHIRTGMVLLVPHRGEGSVDTLRRGSSLLHRPRRFLVRQAAEMIAPPGDGFSLCGTRMAGKIRAMRASVRPASLYGAEGRADLTTYNEVNHGHRDSISVHQKEIKRLTWEREKQEYLRHAVREADSKIEPADTASESRRFAR